MSEFKSLDTLPVWVSKTSTCSTIWLESSQKHPAFPTTAPPTVPGRPTQGSSVGVSNFFMLSETSGQKVAPDSAASISTSQCLENSNDLIAT